MVLAISYDSNYWGTISSCSLLGGVVSTSNALPVGCTVKTNTLIYITNIAGFMSDPNLATSTYYRLKIKFLAASVTATNTYTINFNMALYANLDAFNNNYQPIFNAGNTLLSGTAQSSCYWSTTSTCTLGQSTAETGTFILQKLTDTYIQAVFAPSSNIVFGNSTVYTHNFLITFNGFDYGSPCSVTGLVFELSSQTVPGNGLNNTFPADSAACGANYVEIVLNSRVFREYWGAQGVASDGIWATNEYLIFYITISPTASNADLPKL